MALIKLVRDLPVADKWDKNKLVQVPLLSNLKDEILIFVLFFSNCGLLDCGFMEHLRKRMQPLYFSSKSVLCRADWKKQPCTVRVL